MHPVGPQTMFGPHATPHARQFAVVASDASQPFVVAWSQSPNPGAHAHAPFAHTSFAPHAIAQPPQCCGSVRSATSQPFDGSPSQSSWFAGHTHAPATQLAPTGHAVPQPPQFAASVWGFDSQPSSMLPSQSTRPGRHVDVHVLAAHVVPGQGVPQPPQFAGSDDVSTHVDPHAVSGSHGEMHMLPEQM